MQALDGDHGDEGGDLDAYGALDTLVERAEAQPDPVQWTRIQVRSALDRLEALDRPPEIKAEAKRQLFAIEQRMLSALLRTAPAGAALLAVAYAAVPGLPLA